MIPKSIRQLEMYVEVLAVPRNVIPYNLKPLWREKLPPKNPNRGSFPPLSLMHSIYLRKGGAH